MIIAVAADMIVPLGLLLMNKTAKDLVYLLGCAVNGITPDKTVVIVTHRPAALEICDRVIDFTNITDHPERA